MEYRAPAFRERVAERHAMVEHQIAHPSDGREPVRDPRVLEAMRTVPRHAFVPEWLQFEAYADAPLPIGHEQTISQPYVVAMMTALLDLEPDSAVLEVGTGSGYQAAVLAELTPHVWTIEIVPELAIEADRNLDALGYDSVRRRCGDGARGWPGAGPFEGVLLTCAAEHLEPALWSAVAPGGRIVAPIGRRGAVQQLVVSEKHADGTVASRTLMPVRFVPLVHG